jgi:hypothetical protein
VTLFLILRNFVKHTRFILLLIEHNGRYPVHWHNDSLEEIDERSPSDNTNPNLAHSQTLVLENENCKSNNTNDCKQNRKRQKESSEQATNARECVAWRPRVFSVACPGHEAPDGGRNSRRDNYHSYERFFHAYTCVVAGGGGGGLAAACTIS